ncbi:hypothetical protein AB7M22_001648 [Pseudomonas sp. ADAK2 TE3594]
MSEDGCGRSRTGIFFPIFSIGQAKLVVVLLILLLVVVRLFEVLPGSDQRYSYHVLKVMSGSRL